jgi:hypothetical protein
MKYECFIGKGRTEVPDASCRELEGVPEIVYPGGEDRG